MAAKPQPKRATALKKDRDHSFTFIDLFAGIGGFHHALRDLGGKCVMTVELDPDCRKVYSKAFNVPIDDIKGDIRKVTSNISEVPEHEVLCAGFPCQPFSKSGAQEGIRDQTRGTLFHEIMTIIEERRPKIVLLENVRNLSGPRHRDTFSTIIHRLIHAGYEASHVPLVLSPHRLKQENGGTPQTRERLFIVAVRKDLKNSTKATEIDLLKERCSDSEWDPDDWNITQFLKTHPDHIDPADKKAYSLRPDESKWLKAWDAFIKCIDGDLPGFPIWFDEFDESARDQENAEDWEKRPAWEREFKQKNWRFYDEHKAAIKRWMATRGQGSAVKDFPASRRKFEWQARKQESKNGWKPKDRDLKSLVLHLRPSGIRVKPPTYLPALVAITQTSIIGDWERRITPEEAALLQGMPPGVFKEAEVSDATAYKQLGNAVNVGIVRRLAQEVFELIGFKYDRNKYEEALQKCLPRQTV